MHQISFVRKTALIFLDGKQKRFFELLETFVWAHLTSWLKHWLQKQKHEVKSEDQQNMVTWNPDT